MHVETIICGPMDVNSYVVHEDGGTVCVAVDPADAKPVRSYIESKNLSLSHILLTHGHFDHIGGVAELQSAFSAQVCVHVDDAGMLHNDSRSLAAFFGMRIAPCHADILLSDGDCIELDGMRFSVLHTPGHTKGGVCYLLERAQALFTGDTLFRLSVGRSDFPDSDEETLFRSIREKIFALSGDYTLYPGHMRASMLSFERSHNPFMRKYLG